MESTYYYVRISTGDIDWYPMPIKDVAVMYSKLYNDPFQIEDYELLKIECGLRKPFIKMHRYPIND